MRLGVRFGLLAQRLRCSDDVVILAWMLGKAIERRRGRWQYRNTVIVAGRDVNRIYWTVAAPEKVILP